MLLNSRPALSGRRCGCPSSLHGLYRDRRCGGVPTLGCLFRAECRGGRLLSFTVAGDGFFLYVSGVVFIPRRKRINTSISAVAEHWEFRVFAPPDHGYRSLDPLLLFALRVRE